MQYKLQLMKVDPDGDECLLTERILTSEETIEHLADHLMQQPGITVEEEEEPEPEKDCTTDKQIRELMEWANSEIV